MAPRVGFEPTTPRLTAECSTIELSRIIRPLTTFCEAVIIIGTVNIITAWGPFVNSFLENFLIFFCEINRCEPFKYRNSNQDIEIGFIPD